MSTESMREESSAETTGIQHSGEIGPAAGRVPKKAGTRVAVALQAVALEAVALTAVTRADAGNLGA